ncbi:MAG: glycerophosphodiester phosphodiesterase [Gaiellales bacterium]
MNLDRRDGRPLRIGHRGAAAIAPENTLAAFRTAVTHGVDLVELDVVDLPGGPLLVAHSLDLAELTHGSLHGDASTLTLAELRDLVPGLPTFAEALDFFATEASAVGLHVDLKLGTRLDELVDAIVTHGLEHRALLTSPIAADLVAVRNLCPELSVALTYPADRPSISRRPYLHPVITFVLYVMRATLPFRLVRLARAADAQAVTLQYRVIGRRTVLAAHRSGLRVIAWTADDPAEIRRLERIGVDGIVSNDPRLVRP